ncbi:MAG: hypothetical protein KF773_38030 [Deltaproteobacteria bacterium]|nr:hypothetical protein [Deltaproteobacteria bacterium]
MIRVACALALVVTVGGCWRDGVAPPPVAHATRAAPSPSSLAGTIWQGDDVEGSITLEFLPDAKLVYTTVTGRWDNGRWRREGDAIFLDTNDHYADYTGKIEGNRMHGTAHNVAGAHWQWNATRTK